MTYKITDKGHPAIKWQAGIAAFTSTASFFYALSGLLSCRFVKLSSDSSGANMHFGIFSWEEMIKVEGTNEYTGQCKDYDTAPESYLWIASIYTALSAVVLGGLITILFWCSLVFSLTRNGWKVFLFMDLLWVFVEMLTIVFYLFGNGCLGNGGGDLRCALSEGGISAIVAVGCMLLTYVTVLFFPPFFKEHSRLGESINTLDFSKGIELQVMSKSANQTDEIGDKNEDSTADSVNNIQSAICLERRSSSKRVSLSRRSSYSRKSSTSTFGIDQFLQDEDFWDDLDTAMEDNIVNPETTSLSPIELDTDIQKAIPETTLRSSVELADAPDDQQEDSKKRHKSDCASLA